MGNALVFVCPHCSHQGQMFVIETNVPADEMRTSAEGVKIFNRTRRRYCSNCSCEFSTSEISEFYFSHLKSQDRLANILVNRIQNGPRSIAIDDPMRLEAIGCLHIVCSVFGLRFHASWEAKYPLSESDCAVIIYRLREALGTLGAESSDAVKSQFGVFLDDRPRVFPVNQETLHRAIRQLKHPSRSRKMRGLIKVFLEEEITL